MRKNIISLLLVSTLFLVSCGSNSKKDPIAPEPPKAVQPYSFYNATTPLIVHRPIEVTDKNSTTIKNEYSISVQLLKYDLVAPGVSVQMKPFDYKYGTLDASIVDTDENGRATFVYHAPAGSEYNFVQGQDVRIEAVMLAIESDTRDETLSPYSETNTSKETPPSILLTQPFLLQFR